VSLFDTGRDGGWRFPMAAGIIVINEKNSVASGAFFS
jgi:hypothetical protein